MQDIYDSISYEELFNICIESKSKSEIFRKLKLSDNSKNWNKFKELLDKHNINLNSLWHKDSNEKRYCLYCGKEITKTGKKFCCSSCATSYNNKHRDPAIYDKVRKSLKLYYNVNEDYKEPKKVNTDKEQKTYYCLHCNKELNSSKKFCDEKCASAYKKNKLFNYYMDHQDEFCRSNFVPRSYIRERILESQNYMCSICGCNMEHNKKPLVFVLDHIDGDASNNHIKNLRMVCPNCDSQLPTFKSKNKKSARRDYFREHIKENVIQQIKDGIISI